MARSVIYPLDYGYLKTGIATRQPTFPVIRTEDHATLDYASSPVRNPVSSTRAINSVTARLSSD